MTTLEIKTQVIGKINQITDNELLMDIDKLISDSLSDSDVYSLSDNHKEQIAKAIEQVRNGKYLTNEQANKEIGKWLNK